MKLHKFISLCLIATLIFSALPILPASAAITSPTLTIPSDNTTFSTPPLFQWAAVSGAVSYKIEISSPNDDSFTISPKIVTTKNLCYSLDKQLNDGLYYWRVTATDSSSNKAISETRSFAIAWDQLPVPIKPLNSREFSYPADPANPILLSWNPVPGADYYQVQVATSNDFSKTLWTKTTDSTSYSPYNASEGLAYNTIYYWRVRAVTKDIWSRDCFSRWSSEAQDALLDEASFKVVWRPNLDINYSPNDSQNKFEFSPQISWDPVPGAVKYELQISPSGYFNTNEYNQFITTYNNSYTPEASLPNEQFYCRFRAYDRKDAKTDWSELSSWLRFPEEAGSNFSMQWDDIATPISPINGDHVDFVRFEWEPVAGASHYQIQVSTDPDTWNNNDFLYIDTITNQTTFTPSSRNHSISGVEPLPANTNLYWRIKPLNLNSNGTTIEGAWSDPYDEDNPCYFVRDFIFKGCVSPSNGSTINPPNMVWNGSFITSNPDYYSLNADHYKVQIKKPTVSSWTTLYSNMVNLSATPDSSTSVEPGETYQWLITPYDVDGITAATWGISTWTFKVSDQPDLPKSSSLELVTPVNNDLFNMMPSFSWTPYDGATQYRILYCQAGIDVWYDLISKTSHSTPYTSYTPSDILSAGNYFWKVLAFNGSSKIGESSERAFSVVSLNSPNNLETIQDVNVTSTPTITPTFKWDSVPNASYYHLVVWADRNLTTKYDEAYTLYNTWTPIKCYADNNQGEGYYWYIYSVDGSGRESRRNDANVKHFQKESVPVNLVSPGNEEVVSNRPVFTWERKADGAATYRIQIATDSTFGTSAIKAQAIVDGPSVSLGASLSSGLNKTLPVGTYYWRVQTRDRSGNYLAWSESRKFSVTMPRPVLKYPTNPSSSNHSFLFTWEPCDGAESYDIQISNTPVFPTSSGITRVYGNAYTPTTLFVPGTYYWRVRMIDPNDNFGPWSDSQSTAWSFEREPLPTVPSISSPVDKASITGALYFEWQGISTAAKYLVQVSQSNLFSSLYDQTITGGIFSTCWAPLRSSKPYPGGTYYWRVAPVDSSGNIGEFSLPLTFTTPTTSDGGSSGGGGGGGGSSTDDDTDTTPLPAPTSLAAKAYDYYIGLSWTRTSSSKLTGYNVYRSESSSGPWSKIGTSSSSESKFNDTGAQQGVTYYYTVTALKSNNTESSRSNVASAARAVVLAAVTFADVPSSYWARTFIETLATKSILGGYGNGTFRPASNITRAEFAKAIVIAKNWSLVDPSSPSFNDVPINHWAYKYIETAKSHKAISGYADGSFKPSNNITRAEICRIVVSTAGYLTKTSGQKFSDVPSNYWAYRFILTARNYSVVNGYADGTFKPSGNTTRAEACKMLCKMLGI